MTQLFDSLPTPLAFALIFVLMLVAFEIGFRIGAWREKRNPEEKDGPTGTLVGSLLALMAFLLAITMGMAADRFDTRRGLVQQEANAIGTAYLRAGYLTQPTSVNITLTDLEVNPGDVAQLLSGLSFTLSNGATTGTLFSSTDTQVTVNSGGTHSVGTTGAAGWGLNNNVAGGLQLNALGFVGPAGLIIGNPGAGGTYSNANTSIAGNPAHNPFLLHSVQFIINISGVTSATTVYQLHLLFRDHTWSISCARLRVDRP